DDGGKFGKGYVHGRRRIDPADWYFDCHFHRDPVMPGSLGVEAIIEALKMYAIDKGLAHGLRSPEFAVPTGIPFAWKYRGQILRTDEEMIFDAHIKEIRRDPGHLLLIADASVWRGPLRIYELTDLAIAVKESP